MTADQPTERSDIADRTVQLVFSDPVEGREDEFNKWYDEVHLPQLLATPGVLSAQRFALCDAEINRAMGATAAPHRYLTIYEMEGDPDEIMARIRESVASGTIVMGDAIDLSNPALSFWAPMGPKVAS